MDWQLLRKTRFHRSNRVILPRSNARQNGYSMPIQRPNKNSKIRAFVPRYIKSHLFTTIFLLKNEKPNILNITFLFKLIIQLINYLIMALHPFPFPFLQPVALLPQQCFRSYSTPLTQVSQFLYFSLPGASLQTGVSERGIFCIKYIKNAFCLSAAANTLL